MVAARVWCIQDKLSQTAFPAVHQRNDLFRSPSTEDEPNMFFEYLVHSDWRTTFSFQMTQRTDSQRGQCVQILHSVDNLFNLSVSSVQSLKLLSPGGGDMTDNSAETLFWQEQRGPLFDVFHPAFPLPITALPTYQVALKDGFREAFVACHMPKQCQFPSRIQPPFLLSNAEKT